MKNYKTFAICFACAAALAFSAGSARAQDAATTAATVAAPIIIKKIASVVAPKHYPPRSWLKAEVVRADGYTITVREQANELMIHTFTFSPEIKDKMQATLDAGGYQYGDKVKILYQPGQTVALRVFGKPSKPL